MSDRNPRDDDRDDVLMKKLGGVVRDERHEDDEDERMRALLAPFDEAELDTLTARAASSLAPAADGEKGDARSATNRGASVISPARFRARSRWMWAATPLAAAAAIALFVTHPWSTSGVPLAPEYDLVTEGDARTVRSDPTTPNVGPLRIERGGAITLILRPRAPGSGSIDARLFLSHDGVLAPWDVALMISDEKAVRIDVDATAIARLPAGASQIVVFVGAPSSLPTSPAAAKDAIVHPRGARLLQRDIVVAP